MKIPETFFLWEEEIGKVEKTAGRAMTVMAKRAGVSSCFIMAKYISHVTFKWSVCEIVGSHQRG